jgi:hypothetical protein
MLYVIFGLKYSIKKIAWKMQYKPIKNCHMENVVLRKDFSIGTIGSFFHAFTQLTTNFRPTIIMFKLNLSSFA